MRFEGVFQSGVFADLYYFPIVDQCELAVLGSSDYLIVCIFKQRHNQLPLQENSLLNVMITMIAVGWLGELIVLSIESETADPAIVH